MTIHINEAAYAYPIQLLSRRPSLLRRLGEALVTIADRHDALREQRRHRARGSPLEVPAYLRQDIGLPPDFGYPWNR